LKIDWDELIFSSHEKQDRIESAKSALQPPSSFSILLEATLRLLERSACFNELLNLSYATFASLFNAFREASLDSNADEIAIPSLILQLESSQSG